MYSKAYQGRNEEWTIGYFHQNKVSLPTGNYTLVRNMGNKVQPILTIEALREENVGKKDNRHYITEAYNAGANEGIKGY